MNKEEYRDKFVNDLLQSGIGTKDTIDLNVVDIIVEMVCSELENNNNTEKNE